MKILKLPLFLTIPITAFILGCSSNSEEPAPVSNTPEEVENIDAAKGISTALVHMKLYNDSLHHGGHMAHHYDNMFHHNDSLYQHHHQVYHHGDTIHHHPTGHHNPTQHHEYHSVITTHHAISH